MPDGHRYGVDHGVCFHIEDKLRTVLWGWAEEPLLPDHQASLEKLVGQPALFDELASSVADEVGAFEPVALRCC